MNSATVFAPKKARAGSHILAMELDHTPVASAPDQVLAIITEAVDAVSGSEGVQEDYLYKCWATAGRH